MSSSVPMPPPDGRKYLKGTRRFSGGRRFGSPYDARSINEAESLAAEAAWSDYFDGRGPKPDEDTIKGAAGLIGGRRAKGRGDPDKLLGDVIRAGPYEAISFQEWGGYTTMESADYWMDNDRGAGKYYDPQTYSIDTARFGGVDADINPEDLDDSDPRKGLLTVADVSSVGKWPAPISLSPTTSKNPKRPRTVAAGYDGFRKVLTVVFRDGTFYNYYGVDTHLWASFVRRRSKGQFIRLYLDAKVRGAADVGDIPPDYKELLYRAARTAQSMAYTPGRK